MDLHKGIDAYIDEDFCSDLLSDMVAIPSIINEERELAEFLQETLDSIGMDARLQIVEKDRANIIASHVFSPEGPKLMFNGHLDTVPVCEGWTRDPFQPIITGDRLYGLGSADMKAGIACAIGAIKAILDSTQELRGSIIFTGVVGEEAYSKGAKTLLKTEVADSDAVIIGEPYTGREDSPIPLGITGKALYELKVLGRSAHGFRPEKGINAIDEAARILVNLDKLKLPDHPRFKGNYCTLKIEGGYKVYSVMVPERCWVEINRLLVPGETKDSIIKDMEDLITSLELEAKVEISLKEPFYNSFEMDADQQLIQIFKEVYQEVTGSEPHFGFSSSITDANVFMGQANIPTLHLGPNGGGIHQSDEYVELSQLRPVTTINAKIATRFLKQQT
jgi:acetylornithine deacetylase/succinyl-diaminopimelate desuccinylase family protein